MKHLSNTQPGNQQRFFVVLIVVLICVLIPVGFLSSEIINNLSRAESAILWQVCLGLFVLSDLLAGRLTSRLWAGYLYLSLMMVWLVLGLSPALLLLVTGAGMTTWLRWQRTIRVLVTNVPAMEEVFDMGLKRVAILGCGLISAAVVYGVAGGEIPFSQNTEEIIWGGLALLVGLVVTQLVGQFIIQGEFTLLLWRSDGDTGTKGHWLNEIMLLFVVMPMVLVYQELGIAVFALLIGFIAGQAVRYYQIQDTQQELTQRVQELSFLNDVGRGISSNLVVEDVLRSVYDRVREISDISLFYVAFYVAEQDTIHFPLVMQEGQAVNWLSQPLNENPFVQHVIHTRTVFYSERTQEQSVLNGFNQLPEGKRYQVYLGVPLLTGEKLIGMMALVTPKDDRILENVALRTLETVANQASLALRNAMLYNESLHLAQNLKSINHSVQKVMFNLNTADALQATCETAIKIAGTQKVALFVADEQDKTKSRLAHATGLTPRHRALYDGPIHKPALYNSEPRIVPNVAELDDRDALCELAEAGEFAAIAEIPMKSGNTIIGMMTLFHDKPHHYREEALELLEMLAYQTTASIEYIELLDALELYAFEQAQLVHLSRISNASLELEKVIEGVMHMLQQMLEVDHVRIGMASLSYGHLQIYHQDESPNTYLHIDQLPELETLFKQPQPGPRIYYTSQAVSEALRQHMRHMQETMLALVPLVANSELLGVVFLGNQDSYHFTDGEWRLLEMVTNQVATQLHNAQLYNRTESALNRRLQQLGLIEDIARQISGSLDVDTLITHVLEAAIRATQAESASIGLMMENGKYRIMTRELVGGVWHQGGQERDTYGGVAGQAIQSGQMQVIDDNRKLDGYRTLPWYHQTYLSSLVIPLITDDRTIGVINIESTELNFFNQERIEFVKNLAGHAVISIQNAALLQERQAQIETLTQLRELSLRLSNDVDPASVVDAVLRTALTLLQGQDALMGEYSPQDRHVFTKARLALRDGEYAESSVIIPRKILLEAATTGEVQIIEDVREHPEYSDSEGVHYISLLVAPIKRGSSVKEVLAVTLPHQGYLKAKANTIALLTIQVTGHLDNADLYVRIQEDGEQMKAILESTSEGILLLDRNGKLIRYNLSAENLLNLSLDEYVGQNFADSLLLRFRNRGEETLHNSMRDALRDTARVLRLEPQRITSRSLEIVKGNKVIYIQEVGSPVMDNTGQINGRLLTFRDITEERELAAYRDEITNMIVHDLRGPLSSIISSLTLNLDIMQPFETDETLGHVHALTDVSLTSAVNLLELVESILDIARLETREMPLLVLPTTVDSLVNDAFITLSTTATEANITVRREIDADLPDVLVDNDKIRRVIINLLDNALSYTPNGGEVLISATMAGRRKVIVRIADSGPGIPADEADKVFEKFRQIKDNVPRRGSAGSGLGLTFCRLAVEAHGQSIWVEQVGPLSGACFAFTLPVAPPDATPDVPPQRFASLEGAF